MRRQCRRQCRRLPQAPAVELCSWLLAAGAASGFVHPNCTAMLPQPASGAPCSLCPSRRHAAAETAPSPPPPSCCLPACRRETRKRRPPSYRVLLHNDNYNRREYVVQVRRLLTTPRTHTSCAFTAQIPCQPSRLRHAAEGPHTHSHDCCRQSLSAAAKLLASPAGPLSAPLAIHAFPCTALHCNQPQLVSLCVCVAAPACRS